MFIPLNDFPNKEKVNASRMVDFPAPFSPDTKVVSRFTKSISVNTFPVERKFFHLSFLNIIKLKEISMLKQRWEKLEQKI